MVVDDLGDSDFFSAVDGLGHLVVIDKDKASLDGFENVAFREYADEGSVIIEYHCRRG